MTGLGKLFVYIAACVDREDPDGAFLPLENYTILADAQAKNALDRLTAHFFYVSQVRQAVDRAHELQLDFFLEL